MTVAVPHPGVDAARVLRVPLLVAAAVRTAFGIVAALVAPALWSSHFALVVLMRPTKEVLLASGFKLRLGDIGLVPVLLSFVPLGLLGVWLFYFLGRAWSDELRSGDGLPRWAQKIVPTDRVEQMCRVLGSKGDRVVVLGRLAVFPSTLMAAAAGASGMSPARFLVADGFGAALSVVEVVGAGWVLGRAYESAGPWITAVGVLAALGLLFALGRWLKQDADGGCPQGTGA